MLGTDEEALICDLAETYHVLNYKALPVKTVALFASGLRDSARIKMKISGQAAEDKTVLLAGGGGAAPMTHPAGLTMLLWAGSEDGQKNRNRPKMIVPQLLGEEEKETLTFDSIESFETKRREILKKGGNYGN